MSARFRARLFSLTDRGWEVAAAGETTVRGLEQRLEEILGTDGASQLRQMLLKILSSGLPPT